MNPSSYRPNHPSSLPPLEATLLPESDGGDRGLMWRGCALVLFLAAVGTIAIVGLTYTLLSGPRKSVWPHETLAQKQQNMRTAYAPTATVTHPDRRGIERFLARVTSACNKQDHDSFRALVDFDALYARILNHPDLPSINSLTRFQMRGQLQSEEGLGAFNRLRLVSVHTFDANHVLAYTIAELPYSSQPYRFWLERSGSSWKLADWEQVDFGYSTSDRYALSQSASLDPLYSQYQLSEVQLQQAQRHRGEGKHQEAKKQLQAAAACQMPVVIRDVQLYLITAEWTEIHNPAEVVKLCQDADPARRIPGVQWHLASALESLQQWEGALAAATAYESVAGFQPPVVEIRARALEQLDREAEALVLYEQLLKFTPSATDLLASLYRLLPEDRKGEWLEYLKQTPDPTQVAVEQATLLLQQHGDTGLARELEKYIGSQAPDSSEHLQLQALLLEDDGQLAEAAALYRQAAELPGNEDEQRGAWWRYFAIMQEAGLTLEAFRTHPRPDEAFQYYVGGFEDDESMLTTREIRPLLAAQLERNPEHPLASYTAGVFAQRDGDFAKAKEYLQRVKPAEGEEEDESYLVSMAEYALAQIAVQEGRALEELAAASAEDRSSTYQQFAGICLAKQDWSMLQRLNDAIRGTPDAEGNGWFRYYEAQLAVHDKNFDRAVQQMLLAKMTSEDPAKVPHQYYVEQLESEVLVQAYGPLEAYRKHPQQRSAFAQYHQRALSQQDWQLAAELCAAHRESHADDPALLSAEWTLALRRGEYEQVVSLLTPWQDVDLFENQWSSASAKEALVISLLRLQRYDEAQAAVAVDGQSDPKLTALVLLMRGDPKPLLTHLNKHRRQQPQLFANLALQHRHEFAHARDDARLAEVFREFGVPLQDAFDSSLVILSKEEATWTIANLQEKFAAVIPGITIGAPREHEAGASYDVSIPGVSQVRVQLTIGPQPYVSEGDLAEYAELTDGLRDAVRAHHSWLALDMTSPPTAVEADEPWRMLRSLLAAIHDESIVAFGYQEPSAYGISFVASDEKLLGILSAKDSLGRALAQRPSAFLVLGNLDDDEPAPTLTRELKQLAKDFRTSATKPTVDVRVAHTQGHCRESVWLRIVGAERTSYIADQFLLETLPVDDKPVDGNSSSLRPGRYHVWAHEILEVRRILEARQAP